MSFNLVKYSGTDEQRFIETAGHIILFLRKRIAALSSRTSKLDAFQHNCCAYLLAQIDRLLKNSNYKLGDMTELASICRNIFELVLTVKYYGTSESDADTFLGQADVDQIVIHEGILEWLRATDPNSPGIKKLAHIRTSKNRGVKPPPQPNVRAMAAKVAMLTEYDGFYKFYSKYIHPSAWIVNKTSSELERDGYREMLVFRCITYAAEICKLTGAMPP